MTLTVNKKHLIYTIIFVTLIFNLIFVQSLYEDMIEDTRALSDNLESAVSVGAKYLTQQLQVVEQISQGVAAQLDIVSNANENQQLNLVDALFKSVNFISGVGIVSDRNNNQFDIAYYRQNHWLHTTLPSDIYLHHWLKKFIASDKTSSWTPMMELADEDQKSLDFPLGYIYAVRNNTDDNKKRVVLSFFAIDPDAILQAIPTNISPQLLVIDQMGRATNLNKIGAGERQVDLLFASEIVARMPDLLERVAQDNILTHRLTLKNKDVLITADSISQAGWTIVGTIPWRNIFYFLDNGLIIRVVSIFLLIGFIFAICFLASRQIVHSMRLLNQAITNVASGDLDSQITFEGSDSVSDLVSHITDMTHKLRERGRYERDTRRASFGHIVQALNSDFFYFTLDTKGTVSYLSPQLSKKWGIPPEALYRHYSEFLTDHPKNNEARRIINNVLNGANSGAYEVEVHNSRGKKYHIEVVKVPIFDYEGKLIGIEGMARNITSRVSDTERFRGLLESAPDAMIITDLNGTVTMVNAQAEKLFGYWRYKLENRHVSTLMPAESQKKFLFLKMSPELRKRFYIRTGMELHILNSMGMLVPVEITLSPIETANDILISISLRDISDRQAAEQALRISEERFRRMVEALQEEYIFYTQRLDGSYIFMTRSVKRILGYTPVEFTSQKMQYIHRQHDRDRLTETFDLVTQGKRCPSFEVEIVKANGGIAVMEVFESPAFDRDGNVRVIEGLLRDRTKEKKAAAILAEAKDAAEAANEAKTLFLSNMSHELRTPLNGVLGYVQLLLSKAEMKPEQQEQLIGIQACGQHLLTLINDILDLTKAESGNLELIDKTIHLPSFIYTIDKILYQKSRQQRLSLRLAIDPDVPTSITGDETKIRQVLINLVSNALKFTKQGLIELRVSLDEEQLKFFVTDTGIGISEEQMQYIFAPFRQGEGGHNHGGTGLGLSISRRIAEAMQGTLTVTSTLGEGSCFVFSIPLRRAKDEQQPRKISFKQELGERINPQDEIKVLVVDDSTSNRNVLEQLLTNTGFLVTTAEDGREAVNYAKAEAFDLVLMDLRMPNMGGHRATRMIHKHTCNPDIQIIAISGDVYPRFDEQMHLWGFIDFIRKPYSRDELLQVIHHHLQLNWENPVVQPVSLANSSYSGETLVPSQITPFVLQLSEAIELGDIVEVQRLARAFLEEYPGIDSNIEYWITRVLACCEALDFEEITHILEQLTVVVAEGCSQDIHV